MRTLHVAAWRKTRRPSILQTLLGCSMLVWQLEGPLNGYSMLLFFAWVYTIAAAVYNTHMVGAHGIATHDLNLCVRHITSWLHLLAGSKHVRLAQGCLDRAQQGPMHPVSQRQASRLHGRWRPVNSGSHTSPTCWHAPVKAAAQLITQASMTLQALSRAHARYVMQGQAGLRRRISSSVWSMR